MRRVLLTAALLAATAVAARANIVPSPLQTLLSEAPTPAELRVRLAAFAAERQQAGDAPTAGDAWTLLGQSWFRAGGLDSALAAFQRGFAASISRKAVFGYADACFARGRDGDAQAALALLDQYAAQSSGELATALAALQARQAWAHTLAGHPDSAKTLFQAAGDVVSRQTEWRYRWARERLAAGDPGTAFRLLEPVAERSRLQDDDVVGLVRACSGRIGGGAEANLSRIRQQIGAGDRREAGLLAAWNAHRVLFAARDHFPLGGIGLWPAGHGRHRAAVVIVEPGDTLANYDSLAVGLVRHGMAVMLLEPRGCGRSVAPFCPEPGAWEGREDVVERLVAEDVREAVRALAVRAGADTSRVLVVGIGTAGPIAIQAAALDARVKALLLLSPAPHPVMRGPLRAMLARTQVPTFFQVAPEDYDASLDESDALYQGANRGASRIVEAKTAGHGAAQLRDDPALLQRFTQWLDAAWGPARPGSSTRPPARRRG